MKEELVNEKRDGSILLPFVIGGLVGAGVALLLAPKTGKELRKDIRDLASDTRDKVAMTIDRSKELFDESKTAVTNAIDAGKKAFTEERDKVRQAA
jgi:gas vesicle protein